MATYQIITRELPSGLSYEGDGLDVDPNTRIATIWKQETLTEGELAGIVPGSGNAREPAVGRGDAGAPRARAARNPQHVVAVVNLDQVIAVVRTP